MQNLTKKLLAKARSFNESFDESDYLELRDAIGVIAFALAKTFKLYHQKMDGGYAKNVYAFRPKIISLYKELVDKVDADLDAQISLVKDNKEMLGEFGAAVTSSKENFGMQPKSVQEKIASSLLKIKKLYSKVG